MLEETALPDKRNWSGFDYIGRTQVKPASGPRVHFLQVQLQHARD